MLGAVVVRHVDSDFALLADLGADDLVLETGDEIAGTQFEFVALGRTARERLAIQLADEIDHGDVTGLRRPRLGERPGLAQVGRETLDGFVDRLLLDLGGRPLQLDRREIHGRDLRHHLDGEPELEVGALVELQVLDLRRNRRAQPAIVHRLLAALVDLRLEHFAGDRLRVALAQHADRRLARPEARQADGLRDLFQLRRHLGLDVGGGDHDRELALQAFGVGLGYLHGASSGFLRLSCGTDRHHRGAEWCGRRDLNPHDQGHQILSLARLPVPPRPHGPTRPRAGAEISGANRMGVSTALSAAGQ